MKKEEGTEHQQKQQKKKPENTFQIRKIPETLIQSYDFILLKDEKKKKRWKKQSIICNQDSQIYRELQRLPILQGQCTFQYYNDKERIETLYQIQGDLVIIKDIAAIPIKDVFKIKLIGCHGLEKKKKIKINIQLEDKEEAVILLHVNNKKDLYSVFSTIIIRKIIIGQLLIPDLHKKKNQEEVEIPEKYEAEIFKISGYMGFMNKWEKKKMIFENEQLKSFRDQKCTFSLKSTKQLWTRFEMHQGYFVLKAFYGIEKIQLGIPLVDFTNVENKKNWLYPLTRLVQKD